jgi:hypothetical protein
MSYELDQPEPRDDGLPEGWHRAYFTVEADAIAFAEKRAVKGKAGQTVRLDDACETRRNGLIVAYSGGPIVTTWKVS